jgi:Mg2+-importing ATPase
LPGKYLSIATAVVFLFVLVIPVTPFAHWFGFVKLPLLFYGLMVLVISAYLFSAEFAKRLFYRKAWDKISRAKR